MRKVCLDGVIFGLQKAGGISRLFADLILHLEKNYSDKIELTLLLPPNQNIEFERIQGELVHTKIIPRKKFRWGKRRFFWESRYLSRLMKKHVCDVWHSSYYVGFPNTPCSKIITFHDMIPELMGAAIPYDHQIKKQSLEAASHILAISHHAKESLAHFWPELSSKMSVIHLGIDTPIEQSDKTHPYFLYCGKRRGYKHFLPTLEALFQDHRFDHYKVITVGGEMPNAEEKAWQKTGRLEMKETLPREELFTLLAESSALLYPSLSEGFGLPALEAFAAGVPLLASSASSLPEVCGKEYPLAHPENPQSYCDTLALLLTEKKRWVSYGEERLKLFAPQKMVENVVKVYLG